MPLQDITDVENNIPKTVSFKRNLPEAQDDDNTFLPPALSSYARALLGENTQFDTTNKNNNVHPAPHPSTNQEVPQITGIYELDFPDRNNTLKQKLSVHFNETKNTPKREGDSLVKPSTSNSSFSVFYDAATDINLSGHSSYASTTNNHTNSEYNDDLMNNSSHNNSIHTNNSPRSIHTSSTTPGKSTSTGTRSRNSTGVISQVHSIKKMRGSRRFGKLGPPKRGSTQVMDSQSQIPPPPPAFNLELLKTPEPQLPETVQKSRPEGSYEFMSTAKEDELRERIEEQKRNNEMESERKKFKEEVKIDRMEITPPRMFPRASDKQSVPEVPQGTASPHPAANDFRKPKTPSIMAPSVMPNNHQVNYNYNNEDQKRKKTITINGIQYEKMELLGRGGSSKVYKVKALSNNKIYAIKKVTFDQFDEACVKGFKGEIDLLIKLRDADRVVKLADHAVGEGSIYLVMECGDTDLAHVLQSKLTQSSSLDLNFVRFHAIELFKCVLAVHKAGIVHSDLKPANFLFVRGILKIIDFGIANAVPDHTANIYKESQIGTPNYMAPEALVEVNQSFPGLPKMDNSMNGQAKNTWKVGKPSDVWSCGCIIYQMIYGRPPYGSYSGNQRIMAIMNPQVRIQYGNVGLGGVKVPQSAIELMKKCLARNPNERFTIEECLESDFLHPKIVNEDFIRDLVHSAVNFGINNRVGGSGIITADIYDKLVDTVLTQIEELNYG
ncbi:serine/threonine-protein kinase Mps1p [[Candida] anglica]|uniref:Serine/threonine-protein kinase Mps1p n=1 Tax=[Candida] anglica TaxID=148631 RepID=A0ABP0EIK4_9ASCO